MATASAGASIAGAMGEAVAQVSPDENVRAYLQNTVLPVLGSSIEELLHHVHASKELERALRERAEKEGLSRRKESKEDRASETREGRRATNSAEANEASKSTSHAKGDDENGPPASATKQNDGHTQGQSHRHGHSKEKASKEKAGKEKENRDSHSNRDSHADDAHPSSTAANNNPGSAFGDSATELSAGADAADHFDPLIWLSGRLRQAAAGPTERYRDKIEKRVIDQIAMEEERQRLAEEAAAAEEAEVEKAAAAATAAAEAAADNKAGTEEPAEETRRTRNMTGP